MSNNTKIKLQDKANAYANKIAEEHGSTDFPSEYVPTAYMDGFHAAIESARLLVNRYIYDKDSFEGSPAELWSELNELGL